MLGNIIDRLQRRAFSRRYPLQSVRLDAVLGDNHDLSIELPAWGA